MNTTMPKIDSPDLGKLKDHMPDLSEFELPKLENVGRTADDTINRLLGRQRRSVWPWVATTIGLVALIGVVVGAFMWMRRPMLDQADLEPTAGSTTGSPTEALGDLDPIPGVEAV